MGSIGGANNQPISNDFTSPSSDGSNWEVGYGNDTYQGTTDFTRLQILWNNSTSGYGNPTPAPTPITPSPVPAPTAAPTPAPAPVPAPVTTLSNRYAMGTYTDGHRVFRIFGQNQEEFYIGGINFDDIYSYGEPEIVRRQDDDTGNIIINTFLGTDQRIGPTNGWTSTWQGMTGYPSITDLNNDTNSWTFGRLRHWGYNPGFNFGDGPEDVGAYWLRQDGCSFDDTEQAVRLSKLNGIGNTMYVPDGYYDGESALDNAFDDNTIYVVTNGQLQATFAKTAVTNVGACLTDNQSVAVSVSGSPGSYQWSFNGTPAATKYGLKEGTSITFKGVTAAHPIAFHTKNSSGTSFATVTGTTSAGSKVGLDGQTYSFYYGDVTLTITSSSLWSSTSGNTISLECYYHGYMGGQDKIQYEANCGSYDWGSSLTTPAPAPNSPPVAAPSPIPAPNPIPVAPSPVPAPAIPGYPN